MHLLLYINYRLLLHPFGCCIDARFQSILIVTENNYKEWMALKLDTIGANIRKCRLAKKLRQEDLAEKTNLSVTYIGMIERGEKTPALETLINILNALGVSADVVLCDVLEAGYSVKHSMLDEKLSQLSSEDRNKIYDVINTMIAHSSRNIK